MVPFSLCSCQYVRGLDGLPRSPGSVSSGAGPSCFSSPSALPLLRHCLSIQGSLLCPFHGSTGLHLGLGSCFRLSPHSTSPREALTRRLSRPVFLSCLPRQGFSDCSLCLSRVGVCHTSPNVHPCAFTGGTVSRCAASLDIYLGFCVAGSLLLASVTSRSISVLRLASRELMALAAGSSSSLAQLVPDDRCDCGLSSSDSTDLRIVWFSRLRCRCHRGVSATSCSAPPSSPLFRCVSLPGVSRPTLWSECFPVFSPRSWVGVPILTVRSLQACVAGVGCVFCQRQGTVGHPAMSSFFRAPTISSLTLCIAPSCSHAQLGR